MQVKKKMEEVEFCRNLRGVNDGKDFPKEFLSNIYHSICSGASRTCRRAACQQCLPLSLFACVLLFATRSLQRLQCCSRLAIHTPTHIHTCSLCLPFPAAPLAISDTVGVLNLAGPSAGASWALMADRSKLQRGEALLLPPEGGSCGP